MLRRKITSPVIPPNASIAVQKIALGGSGGRVQNQKEVIESNTWNFDGPTYRKAHALPPSLPPSPPSPPSPAHTDYILISKGDLKRSIKENVICKMCLDRYHHERRVCFQGFCDKQSNELADSALLSDLSPTQKLARLNDIIKNPNPKVVDNVQQTGSKMFSQS